jgi:hypothetical protein
MSPPEDWQLQQAFFPLCPSGKTKVLAIPEHKKTSLFLSV